MSLAGTLFVVVAVFGAAMAARLIAGASGPALVGLSGVMTGLAIAVLVAYPVSIVLVRVPSHLELPKPVALLGIAITAVLWLAVAAAITDAPFLIRMHLLEGRMTQRADGMLVDARTHVDGFGHLRRDAVEQVDQIGGLAVSRVGTSTCWQRHDPYAPEDANGLYFELRGEPMRTLYYCPTTPDDLPDSSRLQQLAGPWFVRYDTVLDD